MQLSLDISFGAACTEHEIIAFADIRLDRLILVPGLQWVRQRLVSWTTSQFSMQHVRQRQRFGFTDTRHLLTYHPLASR
jgi:hypothetical protein